jgi:hypothetical protein
MSDPIHVQHADLIREAQAQGWREGPNLLELASLCQRTDRGDVIAPIILADDAVKASEFITTIDKS